MTDKDKAAVEALLSVRCPPTCGENTGILAVTYTEGARAILDAIRKGEVPGVIFDHGAVAALMRAAARLENGIAETERADKATAERDRLAGLLSESRRRLQGFYRNPPAMPIARDLLNRIDAALAEVRP